MKKIIFVLAFMMATTIRGEAHIYYNDHATISIQTFYDKLSPYGEWISTPEYGYVWRPYFDDPEGFKPYCSGGNWVYTDLGWTWVSDYPWGWATFHYGRWYFDDFLGWMWMPGYEWAPAWVTWGSYNDCWAWAPMGPNIQVNVNVNWHAPVFWWTFVPYSHFCTNNWYSYIYNKPVQINRITYITNIFYQDNYRHNNGNWFYGPRVSAVEKHLNTRISRMQVVDSDKPGNLIARNGRVSVYRPSVTNERGNVRPGKYRNKGTVILSQKNQQTTNLNTKRVHESGVENRKSNQTTREIRSSGVNTQQVKRTVSTERTLRNDNAHPSSGQLNNEANSRSVKINRTGPARETVKPSITHNSNVHPGTNVKSQQSIQSSNRPYLGGSRSSGFDRIPGKSNNANVLTGNKSSSRSSMESRPVRSSSSSRTRNN